MFMKNDQDQGVMKKGTWSSEEDSQLAKIVSQHGPGRWNLLAQLAGLQRSGKSCRLRWLNYLRPNVRHGGFAPEEQIRILQLHLLWGNRWARIAEQLPGRTDNEIKNYWRTRILKHAKHLNCDINSQLFKNAIQHVWIPTLLDRIKSEPRSESCSDSGSESYMGRTHLPEDAGESGNNIVLQPGGVMDDSPADGYMGFRQAQINTGDDGNGPDDGPVAVESSPCTTSAYVLEDFDDESLEKILNDEELLHLVTTGF